MDSLGVNSLPSLLRRLELGSLSNPIHYLHGHLSQTPRIRQQVELHGHQGCVNRLAFSDDYETLISASDDCTLRLWDVASLRQRAVLDPGHMSNIFGVAFMPHTGNAFVASSGLDHQVRHTSVERAVSTLWSCHSDSVKMVTAVSPHVFISASIDGTARQFDVRVPPFHSKYAASTIIVRIAVRDSPPRGIFSAVLSPQSDNHLLVAASEPCLRIYDRRRCGSFVARSAVDERQLHPKSIGECVQKLTPPHMHESSPEICLPSFISRHKYATFATYSPDGKQVVASFYDDMVHVFDLPGYSHTVTCQAPFQSKRQLRYAVFRFLQDTVRLFGVHLTQTVGCANRVLEIDPQNVLALVLKAEALLRRNRFGDMRSSFAVLATAIQVIQEDGGRIAQLWGLQTAEGPMCMSAESPLCADRAEIWLNILQYRQACALFRMVSMHNISHSPDSSQVEFTRKRLDNLNALTTRLDQYREAKLNSKGRKDTDEKALGNSFEKAQIYKSTGGRQRGEILQRLFDSFFDGLPDLQKDIQTKISGLRGIVDNDMAVQSESDSTESCSTDTVNDLAEDKLEALELFEKQRQHSGEDVEKDDENLWGPPPSAQRGWRSFYGHSSTQTDIKEARFYGARNQVVLSGSDDGFVYMWAARTGYLLTTVHGDDQIVNCVLPHPTRSMIMASGIDDSIKVLTPEGRLERGA